MTEREIFIEALQKAEGSQRSSFLDDACGTNSELRERIEQLLAKHDKEESFFVDAAAPGVRMTTDAPIAEKPGTTIGPYKLLQEIGEGGMGVVYMAEQKEPVRRRVALKIIKPGMDTKQVIARFEAERQALAMMDHPNVAKALDAGTTDSGRPYFVMELVKGVPVTQYCDERQLTPRERLELFVPICQAVQHAHQKGIIHRDLKPSNVLIAEYDDRAVPRIIDFGVAKAIHQQLTERTMFTHYGQIVGTLEYMSPEQAKLNQLDIDTRSDVYSLGVLLYELLTGSTPLTKEQLRSAAHDEMLRLIREEEPEKPSTRLSHSRASLPTISAQRRTDPEKLGALVRGELDWIVMKALEKDRSRRYETSLGLAADLRRFLNNEPVEACPPSAAYRLKKFAQRNKTTLATLSLVAAALIFGIVGTTWQAFRATRAKNLARSAEMEAIAERVRATRAEQDATRQRDLAAVQRDENRRLLYLSDMSLAGQAWHDNNAVRTLKLLDRHFPAADDDDLRGFEWYHLWRRCEKTLEARRIPLSSYGRQAQYSPKGTMIAVCQAYGIVTLLDTTTLSQSRLEFDVGHRWIGEFFLAFSPDGDMLAYPSADTVRLRHMETDRQWDLPGVSAEVRAACFSPDGKLLATGDDEGFLCLWDPHAAQEVDRIRLTENVITSAAFSPDGMCVALGATDGVIRVWDITNHATRELRSKQDYAVYSIAFSPAGGGLLASGGADGAVRLWHYPTGEERRKLTGHQDHVICVAFDDDGKTIATGSRDRTIKLWDATSFEEIVTLRGHASNVTSVAFSPDGDTLVSTGLDSSVMLWDLPQQRERQSIKCGQKNVQLLFLPDGKRFFTREGSSVDMWDIDSCSKLYTYPTKSPMWSMAVSECGTAVAGCANGEVELWDVDSRRRLYNFRAHDDRVFSVTISPDGKTLVTSSKLEAKIWNLDGRTWRKRRSLRTRGEHVALSPSFTTLAASGIDGTVTIWRLDSDAPPQVLRGHTDHVLSLAFSPDGKMLATSGLDMTVRHWDLASEQPECRVSRGHGHIVWQCTFLDDCTVASASFDGTVRLWNSGTGDQRFVLIGDPKGAISVAFCPQRRLLAAASQFNGHVYFWRAAEEEDVERLRGKLAVYLTDD